MREFVVPIEIAAPPARVWAVMADLKRWPAWTASIASVTMRGAMVPGIGSEVRVRQPKLLPSTWMITDWRPNAGFTWVTQRMGVRAVGVHAIEPTTSGSRVTLSLTFEGVLAPLVAAVAGDLTMRYIQMEANGLKAASERAP